MLCCGYILFCCILRCVVSIKFDMEGVLESGSRRCRRCNVLCSAKKITSHERSCVGRRRSYKSVDEMNSYQMFWVRRDSKKEHDREFVDLVHRCRRLKEKMRATGVVGDRRILTEVLNFLDAHLF